MQCCLFVVILGLLYHPILLMFAWAYYKIVYTDPKGPPMQVSQSCSQMGRFIIDEFVITIEFGVIKLSEISFLVFSFTCRRSKCGH